MSRGGSRVTCHGPGDGAVLCKNMRVPHQEQQVSPVSTDLGNNDFPVAGGRDSGHCSLLQPPLQRVNSLVKTKLIPKNERLKAMISYIIHQVIFEI